MASSIVVVIVMAAADLADPSVGSMTASAQRALGQDATIVVRGIDRLPGDGELVELETSLHAEAVIDVVNTPEVLQGVKDKHQRFKTRLEAIGAQYGIFSQVRGMGMLIGSVLSEPWKGKARDVLVAAEQEALMVLQAGADVVRFAPSLVIEDADIDEGLERFERAIARLVRG